MLEGLNRFGLTLLEGLATYQKDAEVALSPPALYLPLALLRGVSSGATRAGLSRALGSSETLTDEERELRIRTLRRVLNNERVSFEASLKARGHRPFSTTFLRRAQELYGVSVQTDETQLPLRLGTQLTFQLKLEKRVSRVQSERLTGLRLVTVNGQHSLNLLLPPRPGFWQPKHKPLQCLLAQLDEPFLVSWQQRLAAVEPEIIPAEELPVLPQIVETYDLLGVLKELDMGPAPTPAADFSLMMISGEAPSLSELRHTLQMRVTGIETSPEPEPLLWWVTDEVSGLHIALGVRWGLTD